MNHLAIFAFAALTIGSIGDNAFASPADPV